MHVAQGIKIIKSMKFWKAAINNLSIKTKKRSWYKIL